MAEQYLHDPDIRSAFEQVRGECVPETTYGHALAQLATTSRGACASLARRSIPPRAAGETCRRAARSSQQPGGLKPRRSTPQVTRPDVLVAGMTPRVTRPDVPVAGMTLRVPRPDLPVAGMELRVTRSDLPVAGMELRFPRSDLPVTRMEPRVPQSEGTRGSNGLRFALESPWKPTRRAAFRSGAADVGSERAGCGADAAAVRSTVADRGRNLVPVRSIRRNGRSGRATGGSAATAARDA
jgi:hypothetical protein